MLKNKRIVIIFLIIFMIVFSNKSFATNTNNKAILESNVANDITIEESVKHSTFNRMLKSGNLPSSFNLRDELNNNIVVKNQSPNSNCWVYAYTSVLETTMARKNQKLGKVYSPMHIDYKTSQIFNRQVGDGGAFNLAIAYSASGYGPVDESDFPRASVYNGNTLKSISEVNLNKEAKARVLDSHNFPSINKSFGSSQVTYTDAKGNEYSEAELTAARNLVKQHLMNNGAVSSAIYIPNTEKGNQVTYNGKTAYSYFYKGSEVPDHAITIVGWDDNFPKENFATGNEPLHDGAYIVLNSWGESFGDNGYFYVSYDDRFIEEAMFGVTNVQEINDTTKYDKLYEYDELGLTSSISVTGMSGGVYMANVFERTSNDSEYISEVGLFIDKTKGVKVYVNPDGDDKTISENRLVVEKTGSNALEAGFHTLQFTPVKLTGTKFTVIVEYINNEEKISVPLEMNLVENNFNGQTSEFKTATSTAKSERGQSYILWGSTWKDLQDLNVSGTILKDTNACIKAYTKYVTSQAPSTTDPDIQPGEGQGTSGQEGQGQEQQGQQGGQEQQTPQSSSISVTGVTLNMQNVSIEVGNSTNLIATITPSNATNQKVTWKSENEAIARVINGVVYGVSEGTTRIAVITEDGNQTTYCTITVSKKTNTADDAYKEDSSGSTAGSVTGNTAGSGELGTTKSSTGNSTEDTSSTLEAKQENSKSSAITSLPYTGINSLSLLAIIILALIARYNYYKNKKYKNI